MERVILANEALAEIRFLDYDIDLDLGDTNDFVIYIPYPEWDGALKPRMFVYVPDTEYGGIIRSISGNTKEDQVQVTGTTWRGMLAQRFICPAAGNDYFTVSGDLNSCIRAVLGNTFRGFFTVSEKSTGVNLNGYQFERYCSMLDGLTKMLHSKGYKLKILYEQTQEGGHVVLSAEPVKDLSDKVQISQDYRLDFISKKDYGFVNHLICLGSGQQALDFQLFELAAQFFFILSASHARASTSNWLKASGVSIPSRRSLMPIRCRRQLSVKRIATSFSCFSSSVSPSA